MIEKTVLPKRLERTTIYESDYVCLYTDKVQLSSGYVIDKYHQLHYPHNAICIVIFIGGIQLFSMGIMGQYMAKTYMETKNRPHYRVAETNREDATKIK